MSGQTDLSQMLATLDVERHRGDYAFVSLASGTSDPETCAHMAAAAVATVVESEGTTYVVPVAVAAGAGVDVDYVAAWLTLTVHSSLAAVGLTAAFSTALADAGISCNVIAGFYHDHLFVPAPLAGRAIETLRALRTNATLA